MRIPEKTKRLFVQDFGLGYENIQSGPAFLMRSVSGISPGFLFRIPALSPTVPAQFQKIENSLQISRISCIMVKLRVLYPASFRGPAL